MSDNYILLWGAVPEVPRDEPYDLSYKRSGNNFGNMLIGHGVVSVLKGYQYISRSQLSTPEEASEKCGRIVIPAANFLWKDFDFGYMADFIEATSLPVTVVGLGAQTNDRSVVSKIHPNTLRLVKIISERSPSLGVRGYYTAEVLAANGILNVEVLGCPSLYTKGKPPVFIADSSAATVENLTVNFSRRVAGHSFDPVSLRRAENALLQLAVKEQLPFVAQDELEELALLSGQATEAECSRISAYFNETPSPFVTEYFRNNSRYFCNVTDWSAFMAGRSGCIGSRLHGNIIALLNGIPGLTIAHDSRTLEVCALTGAPYLHVKECVKDTMSPAFLLDRFANADYSLFQWNMKILFSRYAKFLNLHGLVNCL